jgi:hypothetical protein
MFKRLIESVVIVRSKGIGSIGREDWCFPNYGIRGESVRGEGVGSESSLAPARPQYLFAYIFFVVLNKLLIFQILSI